MSVCLSLFFVSDNSDLIACMVVSKDGGQAQRFLAVDVYQMSLVEPETKRLGWGVVKFAGLLQVNEMQHYIYFKCAITSQLILDIVHSAHSSSCSSISTGHAGVRC